MSPRRTVLAIGVAAVTVAVLGAVGMTAILRDDGPPPSRSTTSATAAPILDEPAVSGIGGVIVDEDAHEWNTASWDQEKIVTVGRYQYSIYWDADLHLVLARRNLDTNAIDTLRFPDRLEPDQQDDQHRSTQLGVSVADGRLHVTYDHHVDELNYRRSVANFLSDPPKNLTRAQFSEPLDLAARHRENRNVTYVRMFNDPEGTLYASYRVGEADSGDTLLHRYDPRATAWTRVGRLFAREGEYALPDGRASRLRNAYTNGFAFDARGRLHVVWTWRERAPRLVGFVANHDLSYAYSDDGGVTWHNDSGRRVADLSRDDPISIDDPGLVVLPAPVGSWLLNQGTLALDVDAQPHIFASMSTVETFKQDEADRRYLHVWRESEGTWQRSWVDDTTVRDAPPPVRGDIVVTPDNDVVLLFAVDGTLFTARATAAADWSDWQFSALGGAYASGEVSVDLERFAAEGVLTIALVEGSDDRFAFALRDLALVPTPGAPGPPAEIQTRVREQFITLRWLGGKDAQTYDVYRSAGAEQELVARDIGARSTRLAYDDRDLEPGVMYRYVIVARNAAGTSPPSEPVTAHLDP